MKKNIKKAFTQIPLSIAAIAILSACQTSQAVNDGAPPSGSIDAAIQRAANTAERAGHTNKSLSALEKLYKRNSENPQAALNYATALRKNEHLNRAGLVLAPFAEDKGSSSAIKSEYAAIALKQGQFEKAEKYAQKAILQDENNFLAYHNLGIALETQGMYEEAERAFRKALDLWQGDPTIIMNNLALNLTNQKHLDEAAEILQKTKIISPNNEDIERNLRIVTALQESNGNSVPKPNKKPNSNPAQDAE